MSNRRRSIDLTEERRRQIALAAAYLGVSGEKFIEKAIDDALTTIAETNRAFASLVAQ